MTDPERGDAPYYDDQRGTGRQQDEYGLGRDYGDFGPGASGDAALEAAAAGVSDGELQGFVIDRLQADPAVDKSLIDVTVQDGRVILEGEVPDRSMRERASDIAKGVPGVRGVSDRLRAAGGRPGNDRED